MKKKSISTYAVWAGLTLLMLLKMAACSSAEPILPKSTPPSITAAGPEPTEEFLDPIESLVRLMEQAVQAKNSTEYFTYVDLSDPVFALEHRHWVDDWVNKPPKLFHMSIKDVEIQRDTATGSLTMSWQTDEFTPLREATFPVQFHKSNDMKWHYVGESWHTLAVDHFEIYYDIPTEKVATQLKERLPEIYNHVTKSLGYEPMKMMEIKLYDSSEALIANTLLSLPRAHGWNEPGESLKLVASPDDPLLNAGVAHEFTHFIEFEWGGTAHTNWPWWLSEGLAVYIASEYEPQDRIKERLNRVRENVSERGILDWNSISVFENTPASMWQDVYAQGFAFVKYVTELFGDVRRNEWLRDMATRKDLEEASQSVLKKSFQDLSVDFVEWLKKN